jgi:hypothetical protein
MGSHNLIISFRVLVAGVLLSSCPVLVGQSVLCPAAPDSAITYSLSAQSSELQSGDKALITVTVKNVSQKRVPFWVENAADQGGLNFQFDVRDEQNTLAQEGHFTRAMKGISDPHYLTPETPIARSGGCIDLLPSETRKYTIDIARLYDVTSPGKYAITLVHTSDTNKSVAESNTLVLKITSPAGK